MFGLIGPRCADQESRSGQCRSHRQWVWHRRNRLVLHWWAPITLLAEILVALKHHTSKLPSLDDLPHVTTFGFRGEAMSSLCALCESVTVVTATKETEPMGAIIQLARDGKVIESSGRVARMVSHKPSLRHADPAARYNGHPQWPIHTASSQTERVRADDQARVSQSFDITASICFGPGCKVGQRWHSWCQAKGGNRLIG